MPRASPEPVAIAVLARAPVPGFAKTRLIPVLGPKRAAALQARLTERAVATATAAATGPVTLWTTPDESHPVFQALAADFGVTLARQGDGDLGARMLTAMAAASGPCLVIGADCPALTAEHLRDAAQCLRGGTDAVVIPVVDGGYTLIGTRRPQPALFAGIAWSTATVMDATRARLREAHLTWREPVTLWDIDRPEDLDRLRAAGFGELVPAEG
jgi:rSAM/selenodomain-associated transferase 1